MILSTARQIQIIADTITDHTATAHIKAERIQEPWSTYLAWIRDWIEEDPDSVEERELLHQFYQDWVVRNADNGEEVKEHYHRIREAIDEPILYLPASQVVDSIPELEWLWKGWIPRGLVSLLAAVSGTGKSYLALDLAKRTIANTTFPDGSPVLKSGKVIYVDTENTPRIFKQRVEFWSQKELDHIYLMLPAEDKMIINFDETKDRETLWDMCWSIEPVLIILDSYGSATLRGENNKEDVQQLLAYFNRLAKDFDAGLLVIHHLRKPGIQQNSFRPMTIDSIRGSSHIPAMARNVLGLQWVPTSEVLDENGPRQLWIMKSNITRYPEPLGVYFESHPQNPEVALIKYGDAPQPYKEPTKTDYCAEWLEDLLKGAEEPMRPKEVISLGKEDGFSRRTIYRAKNKLPQVRGTSDDQYSPDNRWQWFEECEEESEQGKVQG